MSSAFRTPPLPLIPQHRLLLSLSRWFCCFPETCVAHRCPSDHGIHCCCWGGCHRFLPGLYRYPISITPQRTRNILAQSSHDSHLLARWYCPRSQGAQSLLSASQSRLLNSKAFPVSELCVSPTCFKSSEAPHLGLLSNLNLYWDCCGRGQSKSNFYHPGNTVAKG